MKRIVLLVITVLFLAGCTASTESFQGQIENISESSFIINCTDEVNKGKKGGINDIAYGCMVDYTSATAFQDANGQILTVDDFLPGSEVEVILAKPVNIRKNFESDKRTTLTAKEIILVKRAAPPIDPFDFNRDEVIKVTIYIGDSNEGEGEVIAVIEESAELDELSAILQNSPPFSGAATADWNNTIVIELSDGSERNLEVTGQSYVFQDQTSHHSYSMDKEKFVKFVGKYTRE